MRTRGQQTWSPLCVTWQAHKHSPCFLWGMLSCSTNKSTPVCSGCRPQVLIFLRSACVPECFHDMAKSSAGSARAEHLSVAVEVPPVPHVDVQHRAVLKLQRQHKRWLRVVGDVGALACMPAPPEDTKRMLGRTSSTGCHCRHVLQGGVASSFALLNPDQRVRTHLKRALAAFASWSARWSLPLQQKAAEGWAPSQ